jgi:hypothetical protein
MEAGTQTQPGSRLNCVLGVSYARTLGCVALHDSGTLDSGSLDLDSASGSLVTRRRMAQPSKIAVAQGQPKTHFSVVSTFPRRNN